MKTVLIAVIKSKRDLRLLFSKKIYRIPIKYYPKRLYEYIAFYEGANINNLKCIRYYGKIKSISKFKKVELLKYGIDSEKEYMKVKFSKIYKLSNSIKNTNRTRISFKFTYLNKLKKSKTIMELFEINNIEKVIENLLKQMKINYKREFTVIVNENKRYRLDFAIFYKNKKIDIECDNEKWHKLKKQREYDKKRDRDLKELGWEILRLKEKEIINNIQKCQLKINNIIY